jgi:hypothetical protein
MMTLADLFDQHAKECLESAERMDDPVRRLLLLRMASEWQRDAAALRGSAPSDGDLFPVAIRARRAVDRNLEPRGRRFPDRHRS